MKINSQFAGGAIAAALGGFAMAGVAQAGQLIVNGDFSNPNEGGGWSLSNSVPGWTNDNGDIVEIGASGVYGLGCYTASCQNMEVNANTFDTVSQTITGLKVGESYQLSWAYGGRSGGGPQALNVSFGGKALTQDSSNGYANWALNTFDIVAKSSSETLTFASVDTSALGGLPSYGNEITAVSLTAVPEPSTWAMMLIGFGGLGAAIRSRRTRVAAAA